MVVAADMNNPGGMRAVGASTGYVSFASELDGMRAMYNDLHIKVTGSSDAMAARYGEDYTPTLRTLISTWAPSTENNTEHYINSVSQWSGIDPDTPLTEDDIETFMPAMIRMECRPEDYARFCPGGELPEDFLAFLETGQRPEIETIYASSTTNTSSDSTEEESESPEDTKGILEQIQSFFGGMFEDPGKNWWQIALTAVVALFTGKLLLDTIGGFFSDTAEQVGNEVGGRVQEGVQNMTNDVIDGLIPGEQSPSPTPNVSGQGASLER